MGIIRGKTSRLIGKNFSYPGIGPYKSLWAAVYRKAIVDNLAGPYKKNGKINPNYCPDEWFDECGGIVLKAIGINKSPKSKRKRKKLLTSLGEIVSLSHE